jgi:hypothetical protein
VPVSAPRPEPVQSRTPGKSAGLPDVGHYAQESGVPLKIAAKIYPEEQRYFTEVLEPLITAVGPLVEFLGEVGQQEKNALLGKAAALLFPIEWPERNA